ncbi:putative Ig domain-containing protein [Nocardioides sp. Bht2]|uniref:putative Ig domain-containing protein n=1 Tax=Nocardioides sp. Bht2 TaxID=3392297 RepID=UPI0039B488D9
MSRALAAARTQVLAVLGLLLVATGLQVATTAPAVANPAGTHLVINEYSGGNGTGTAATDEYIELYNPTSETITFTGTIQYKSASGSTYTAVSPVTNFVVPAYGYWLVAGINYSGVAAPDSRYSFDGSASTTGGGHIALTGATTGVTTPAADPLRVDLLGFGTANTPEGTAAPNHPPAGGSLRRTNARDTDNNSVDFIQSSTRSPRSSTSPATTMTDPGAQSFAVDTAITPFSVTASGGRAPYTYAVSAGSLPDGLSILSTIGEISGTPTAARAAAAVTVRATDANGDPSFRTFSIEVTDEAPDPVTVTSPGSRSLTVGTEITPFSLATSGGTAPYTYAVTGGSLPDGLTISPSTGEISGTPTTARAAADVTVTATDDEGSTGSTTFSVSVARGTLSTATPTIDDTEPAVGDVLTASPGEWGPAPVQLVYQWLADDAAIDDATSASLTVTTSLVGARLAVRVTGSRAEYDTTSVDSLATSAVVASAVRFTTSPVVAGTLVVGGSLTADPGTTVPVAEGVAYQWRRDGAPITDATDATYTLVAADLDADISVTVSASHTGYDDGSETSPARGPVAAATFTTGPTATITGTPVVGGTLTGHPGTTTPTADSFTYTWTVDGDTVATTNTLDLTPAMLGETVTLTITAQRHGYTNATNTSDPTNPIAAATFTTGPTATITGTARIGQVLTASAGSPVPTPDSLSYRWYADETPIADANTPTLALTRAHAGRRIAVEVVALRTGFAEAVSRSSATAAVADDPAPSLTLSVSGPNGQAPSTSTTAHRGAKVVVRWSSTGGDLRATGKLRKVFKKRLGAGPIPRSGRISVRLQQPRKHWLRLSATNASGTTTASAAVSVIRVPKRLHVDAPMTAKPGATIVVRARGLGLGERYSITVSGAALPRQVLIGRTRPNQIVVRRISVPESAVSGKRFRITVTGSTVRRTGSAVVRVR